jgi:hypothetical protein
MPIMTKREFMKLLHYPSEWSLWSLYPDELFQIQLTQYTPGDEEAAEHHRNGAFHWWLKMDPSADILIQLVKLTYLDPEQLMGEDVRTYIAKSPAFNSDVAAHIHEST